MLHALIHGKLDESVPEPSRLEDALTSTIIGTLALVDSREILCSWLNPDAGEMNVRRMRPSEQVDYWFWPRLPYAEPDCVIRIGSVLFVIEAKFRSSKSGASATDHVAVEDQLVRQVLSINRVREARQGAPSSLIAAIDACTCVFVYLVDSRKLASAQRELKASAILMPEATLTLVTWQSLYSLLARGNQAPRWRLTLSEYLERCGLDAFCGFTAPPRSSASARDLTRWCASDSGALRGRLVAAFRRSFKGSPMSCLAALSSWRYCVTSPALLPGSIRAAMSVTAQRSSLLTRWPGGERPRHSAAGRMRTSLQATMPHPRLMNKFIIAGFRFPVRED